MPSKSYAPYYSSAPAYSWTGMYAGLNVGYGWGGKFLDQTTYPGGMTDNSLSGKSGGLFGGQVGYNWHFAPSWVAGLEFNFDYANLKGSYTDTWCTPATCGGIAGWNTTDVKLSWLGLANARLGYLLTDRILIGVDGGFAFGRLKGTFNQYCTPGCSTFTQETTQGAVGWDAGAFAEWAFADHWTTKLDYKYVDLTSQTQVSSSPGWTQTNKLGYHTNLMRFSVNYKF